MKTQDLIDSTSMERITRELGEHYLITFIIDVQDEDLARIGDLLYHGMNEDLTELLVAGKISLIHDPKKCAIPFDNHVEVIRLEPAYLVKDMREKWV